MANAIKLARGTKSKIESVKSDLLDYNIVYSTDTDELGVKKTDGDVEYFSGRTQIDSIVGDIEGALDSILENGGGGSEYELTKSKIDTALVGSLDNSIQLGPDANASGIASTAVGNAASATGTSSIALGKNASASSASSTALGHSATASDTYTIAIGSGATVDKNASIAIGRQATATAIQSVALGHGSSASGISSTAVGRQAKASADYSTAIGNFVQALGNYSTALGEGSSAEGLNATAVGTKASATANSVALGKDAATSNSSATAIGEGSKATGFRTTALGSEASASGTNSTALGRGASTGTSIHMMQLGHTDLATLQSQVQLTVLSDIRDKTDIEEVPKALDFIKDLNPITYVRNDRDKYISEEQKETETYKDYLMVEDYDRESHSQGTKKGGRRRVGLSAQEVRKKIIEHYGSDNYANVVNDNFVEFEERGLNIPEGLENKLTMSYETMVPFLIKAIQEQQEQIEELKNKINK